MFGLTALELPRIQFGFTVSFHIVFPAITIGLASCLAVIEGLWLWRYRLPRPLSPWASFPASSWPNSSAPTGIISQSSRVSLLARCSPMKYSPPSSSKLCWRCAVRTEQGRTRIALLRNDHGGNRHADLSELDSNFKRLDAYA
jgi:Cytochrome bd terminal oxidase subunit I